ncbi:30S small subunit ribosomal protein S21e [Tremella mesenterica]|uniref:30S small subunit ribosomal protein S21e n=1 Tax=Tremella mesenterica TaxID=5217 RepID=A0A4Q1BQ54_TREME|nr:30S small subunit ribosomal protein S21e [Tremella mesenterica]
MNQADNSSDRLVTAKDHAAIQISVADVNAEGKAVKGSGTTIVICGRIRAQGDSDDSINRIATKDGLLKNVWSYSR